MPSFRRRASVIDAERVEEPAEKSADADQARALAEEAEAEAAEAEAVAAAARARARAIRLRREAAESTTAASAVAADGAAEPVDTDTDTTEVEPVEAEAVESDGGDASADGTSQSSTEGEASVADQDADAPSEEAHEKPAKRRRWGRVLKIATMALAVLLTGALLTASGYMVWQHRQAMDRQQLNAEYAAAGRQSVVTLMSLDFNTAEQNVQSIIDNSTGQFKTDFESQAQDFVKVAQDSKVVTDVTVTSTAVESMDEDSAVVLVAATSRVTNSAGAEQEPRAWRLSVDLQRDGDQIKMSKVEFVP